jgi:hypothetical protein
MFWRVDEVPAVFEREPEDLRRLKLRPQRVGVTARERREDPVIPKPGERDSG